MFKRECFTHRMLSRQTSKAIYEVIYHKKVLGYEVIKIFIEQPNIYSKTKYERYPSDEQFGDKAWSYQDINMAKAHYRGLR